MSSTTSILLTCVGCPSPFLLLPLSLSLSVCLSGSVLLTTPLSNIPTYPASYLKLPQAPPWRLPGARELGDKAVCGGGFLGPEESLRQSRDRNPPLSSLLFSQSLALGSGEEQTKLSQHCELDAMTGREEEDGSLARLQPPSANAGPCCLREINPCAKLMCVCIRVDTRGQLQLSLSRSCPPWCFVLGGGVEIVGQAFLYNLTRKKVLTDLPTGQADRGNRSLEAPSSPETLVCALSTG